MRLRINVRRHSLPETPIIWNVDSESSTIAQLLEKVNEIIPIESGEWGLEDYAVELRGSNGVNFECLHFQPVGKVMKEDDEVIIRPLLTQDLKMRRVSGRIQITSDGKHLVDGLPFGRPLLRRPAADRPAIPIPPRKRQRITYNEDEEDDDDDEGFQAWRKEHRLNYGDEDLLALEENEEANSGESVNGDGNRQLVLHADFEDDYSEDDEDFVPGEDEESNEDADEAEADEDEIEDQKGQGESAINTHAAEDEVNIGEPDLNDVSDDDTRTKIRKLHSAFPTSPLAVCKYVLDGSGGDLEEAYGTMSLGFQPVRPASAITEASKATPSVLKTRSKKRKALAEVVEEPEVEEPDSMQVEAAESADSLLLEHYDQNGLPPGSITSGKPLSIMAEVVQSSPGRPRPNSGTPNSAFSNKSVRFSLDEGHAKGFTSNPAIARESLTSDSEEESEDSGSEATSSSGDSSSDEDSSSSDEGKGNAKEESTKISDTSSSDEGEEGAEVSDTSSSGSDSDSDSDSSSDDDSPEETSSKQMNANISKSVTVPIDDSSPKPATRAPVPPGSGKKSTNARNVRRRQANALSRFKEKGILPAGTSLAEFSKLSDVNNDTSPEEASAALEVLRAQTNSAGISGKTSEIVDKSKEFEARRQALFASLEAGGIEVGPEPSNVLSKKAPRASSTQVQESTAHATSCPPTHSTEDPQEVSNALSTAPETHQPSSSNAASQIPPKSANNQASAQSSKPATPSGSKGATTNGSATETKPPTPASESAPSAAISHRTKLDLGAGRRMLFGALGIKAPKSKKDEEKVRSDLMKDVRPILTPKVAETAPEEGEAVEDEDPEVWREKIIYRAVECCHDGIELSEPPFPFVQRWDPQQQGGWSQKGKNGGKGKKTQRDESQYYQDEGRPTKRQKQPKGKHSYVEQQEYLEASYEPSYQEDSLMESEEPTRQTRFPTDIELEVNRQLRNDLNEEASAQVSQGPEDLAPLPEDPKTLVDLQDGQAKPGMTIAFKELTMSEETKWQPEISAYRTAVVNVILDGGELQLTLALRDRMYAEKVYDTETGERIYGKFDMPDQDDDEDEDGQEDDGIRHLTFSELVEPKIVQAAPAGLENSQADDIGLPKGTSIDSQTLSHEHEDEAVDAQFSHVTETPLNSGAPESNLQESIRESVPESPQPDAQQENQETNQDPTAPTAQPPIRKAEEQTPKPTAHENPAEIAFASASQENVPVVKTGKGKEITEDDAAEKQANLPEQELTPAADPDTSIGQISTDARLKISQIIKDAGFRSSIYFPVLKDIRPTGMESPGDAKVFDKLMKDMTEIESNPPYSPKFHGLDASSPIKKLRPVSPSREMSSPPGRVQSIWQTIDTDAASSPALQEVDESSWHTIDPEDPSSLPVNVPPNPVANSEPARKFDFQKLTKSQEMWEALQPKNRKTGVDSPTASLGLSTGLDGTNEKDGNASIQYPKLSVNSSFTSQVSDHGRQPDINFDDSIMTNGDNLKVTALEDGTFLNPPDDPMSEVELELPSHKSSSSSHRKKPLDDQPSDDDSQPPRKSTINGSAKSRSQTPDIPQGSPSSDHEFPPIKDSLSQPSGENTTSVQSKAAMLTKIEKGKKKAQNEDFELSDDEDMTPKASQKKSRSSKRESSLPSASQTRKSPRHSKVRESQPQASQSRPSQSQPRSTSTQQSVVVDLTVTSSEVEDESEDDVAVSEVEQQPKRLRMYALGADDDEEFVGEDSGWIPKKSNSQKPVETRRQTSTSMKASSQSSLKTSRRKTTARF